jgi:hypothetical protein
MVLNSLVRARKAVRFKDGVTFLLQRPLHTKSGGWLVIYNKNCRLHYRTRDER